MSKPHKTNYGRFASATTDHKATSSIADESPPKNQNVETYAKVKVSRLNQRSAPHIDATIMGELTPNSTVKIVSDKHGGFYQVITSLGTGFCMKKFLDPVK